MIARQTLGGLAYQVRQLTVREVFAFYDCPSQKPEGNHGVIGDHLFKDISIYDIPRFTDLKIEQLLDMVPTDLEEIICSIREANPNFFLLRQKEALARAAQHIQEQKTK